MIGRFSKTIVYGALLVILALIFYPFQVRVVPVWKIQVVDSAGKPLSSMPVAQDWRHYSFEQESHWEESVTDENGYVAFPERLVRASLARRLINLRPSNLPFLPHASSGPYSFILVLAGDEYLNDDTSYSGREAPPSQVVLRKRSEIRHVNGDKPLIK